MKKSTLALITLAVIANTILWLMLKNQTGIAAENGPMENFQIVCLALSFLLWLGAAFAEKFGSPKIILFSLALFNLSFLVLELDTRDFDAPFFKKIFNGKIRDAWLGCLWLAVAVSFFRKIKPAWAAFLNRLKTSSGVVMIVSGVFWLVSGLFDKSLLGRKELYREELMEVNATLLMLISALLFLLNRKNAAIAARNLLSRPSHRGRSERGSASGSEGVWPSPVRRARKQMPGRQTETTIWDLVDGNSETNQPQTDGTSKIFVQRSSF